MFYNIVAHALKLKSVAAHQMPLGLLYSALYNPPRFPIYGARFPLPYASTFQAQPQKFLPKQHPVSVILVFPTIGSSRNMALRFVAAFVLPRGLSLPTNANWKCCTDAVTCSHKNFDSHHTTSCSSTWIGVCRVPWVDNTGALVYSTDFTNTYYHPSPAHIG